MKFYYSDLYSFVKKLSLAKVWNASLVWLSYTISKSIRKPIQWGVPFSISIEPTTACNLRCPECPSGLRSFTRATGNLKEDFFRKVIDEIGGKIAFLNFYFQGEPYINKQFLEMVKYANAKKIYTGTSTNGHFLDDFNAKATVESGLDRIIISVDGTTQDVYEAYRKEGELEKVIEGAKNLIKWKKQLNSATPHIIFQFLVVKPNEHQIPEIYKLAEKIGVDEVKLKTAQIYNYQSGSELIPSDEKYARYTNSVDGTYKLKYKIENHCWKLWHACVITWNGMVVPCCFDKDAKYKMGDMRNEKFKDIWRGKAYIGFRKKLLKSRSEIDICTNCTEGCKVWT